MNEIQSKYHRLKTYEIKKTYLSCLINTYAPKPMDMVD